jgi:hypothetical protein
LYFNPENGVLADMLEFLKFEFLGSIAVTVGCITSPAFAASVIAGTVGMFVACVIALRSRQTLPTTV